MFRKKLLLIVASFFLICGTAHADDDDVAQRNLLAEGFNLLQAGLPALADKEFFSKIITYYENKYRDDKATIFIARGPMENIHYAMQGVLERRSVKVLVNPWADAQFLQGYALIEQKQFGDAKIALKKAIGLSPSNSRYLSELGHVMHAEKDWAGALAIFLEAERSAELSPPDLQTYELARALRGSGFSLIELGRLNEAEAKFRKALALNANDDKARQELKYIEHLRSKPQRVVD